MQMWFISLDKSFIGKEVILTLLGGLLSHVLLVFPSWNDKSLKVTEMQKKRRKEDEVSI